MFDQHATNLSPSNKIQLIRFRKLRLSLRNPHRYSWQEQRIIRDLLRNDISLRIVTLNFQLFKTSYPKTLAMKNVQAFEFWISFPLKLTLIKFQNVPHKITQSDSV